MNLVLTFLSMFPPPVPSPYHHSQESQEEFDSLFDSVAEEQVPSTKGEAPPPLTDNDLAVFDPCYKQGDNNNIIPVLILLQPIFSVGDLVYKSDFVLIKL